MAPNDQWKVVDGLYGCLPPSFPYGAVSIAPNPPPLGGVLLYPERMPRWLVSVPDRLDAFLASDGRMLSRAKAQQAIDDGLVKVNDELATKSSARVQEGDTVDLESEEEAPVHTEIIPTDLHIPVLYEDDSCFVINKPSGVSVHPGPSMPPGEITLLHGIAFLFQERNIPFRDDSVLVHRLDKDTTGCLLVAKTQAAHKFLQGQFETRTIDKRYLALVAGVPSPEEATIDAPIGRSNSDRTKMAVNGASSMRSAQTTYKIIAATKNAALLECTLHTGRTHQIRVHLSTIGHPVLGDGNYATEVSQRLGEEYAIRSICLHAWKISFISPEDKKVHPLKAPPPQPFIEVLSRMNMNTKDIA